MSSKRRWLKRTVVGAISLLLIIVAAFVSVYRLGRRPIPLIGSYELALVKGNAVLRAADHDTVIGPSVIHFMVSPPWIYGDIVGPNDERRVESHGENYFLVNTTINTVQEFKNYNEWVRAQRAFGVPTFNMGSAYTYWSLRDGSKQPQW